MQKSHANDKSRAAGRTRRLGVGSVACVVWLLSVGPSLASEPRAIVRGNLPEDLATRINAVVEVMREPPSSAFEARRRASGVSELVVEVLRSEGYYGYTVSVDVEDGPPLRGVVLVDPGRRFTIGDITFAMAPAGTTSDALLPRLADEAGTLTPLRRNSPGRTEAILAAEAATLALLRDRGFADAEVAPRRVVVDHAITQVSPTFNFTPGPLVKLGAIRSEGETRTLPRWLRRIPDWQPGDTYSPAHLRDLELRLLETGAFDRASVILADPDPAQPEAPRPVIVQLADKPDALVEAELSYSSSEGIGADASYSRFNLFGRGDTVRLGARLAQIEQRLEAEVRLPHWQTRQRTAALAVEAFQDDTEAFREIGVGARLDVVRRFGELSFVSLGGSANVNRGREPSFLDPAQGIERDYFALALRGAFAMDRTDNRLNPTRGWRFDGELEPTLLSGDANLAFGRTQVQATAYVTPAPRLTLAGRARAGALLGGAIPDIPSPRRLYAGGGGSVRGYEFQGIGPRYSDPDRTPVGGLSLVEVSAEVRYRLENSRFGFVAFADAGSLSQEQLPDFTGLRVGAGIGVRYFFDFAPVRFDVAFPLDNDAGGQSFQIYIGVGQGF